MTQRDEELLASVGMTMRDVDRAVDKIERGDYSDWDFSKVMTGSPMDHERTRMVSAPVGESRIAAMKRITQQQGITRAEFIRRAIDHELLANA